MAVDIGRRSTTPRAPGVPADRRPAGADRRGRSPGSATPANDLFGKGYRTSRRPAGARPAISSRRRRCSPRPATRTSKVTLHTSDVVPGFVESATLFAEQAKDAGVTVNDQEGGRGRLLRHRRSSTRSSTSRRTSGRSGRSARGTSWRCSPTPCGTRRTAATRSTTTLIREAQGAPDGGRGGGAAGSRSSRSSTTRAATSSGRTSQPRRRRRATTSRASCRARSFNLGGWNYRDVWLES